MIKILHPKSVTSMGQCGSCSSCTRNNQVRDISEDIHSDSSDDDYVERVTHITADIHEMIRRRDHDTVKHILLPSSAPIGNFS